MILNILILFHIIISCLLILFILLNRSKGSEISANFNTSNTNIFDVKSSNVFLKKIIITLALLSLILNFSITSFNKNVKNNQEKPLVKLIEK